MQTALTLIALAMYHMHYLADHVTFKLEKISYVRVYLCELCIGHINLYSLVPRPHSVHYN